MPGSASKVRAEACAEPIRRPNAACNSASSVWRPTSGLARSGLACGRCGRAGRSRAVGSGALRPATASGARGSKSKSRRTGVTAARLRRSRPAGAARARQAASCAAALTSAVPPAPAAAALLCTPRLGRASAGARSIRARPQRMARSPGSACKGPDRKTAVSACAEAWPSWPPWASTSWLALASRSVASASATPACAALAGAGQCAHNTLSASASTGPVIMIGGSGLAPALLCRPWAILSNSHCGAPTPPHAHLNRGPGRAPDASACGTMPTIR